ECGEGCGVCDLDSEGQADVDGVVAHVCRLCRCCSSCVAALGGSVVRSNAPSAEYVAAGLVVSSTVDVWHAGRVTALEVPVVSGRFVVQRDQDVPERLDVTLPVEWGALFWTRAAGVPRWA